MDLLESAGELQRHEAGDARVELGDDAQRAGQILAVDILLGDVRAAAPGEAVVHAHHVLVMDAGGRLGLASEALHDASVFGGLPRPRLQDHAPLETGLTRQVDDPHATAAELALDLEAADRPGRRRRHGSSPGYSSGRA